MILWDQWHNPVIIPDTVPVNVYEPGKQPPRIFPDAAAGSGAPLAVVLAAVAALWLLTRETR